MAYVMASSRGELLDLRLGKPCAQVIDLVQEGQRPRRPVPRLQSGEQGHLKILNRGQIRILLTARSSCLFW